jgi:tetratricopeptide (TPR) repeat protein
MKYLITCFLLILTASMYASTTGDILKQADDLIAKKKYESAYKVLSDYDKNMENPDIVVKEVDIVLNYFVQSIMHQMFALTDLDENDDIMTVRGRPGEYTSVSFQVDKILNELIKKNPDNGKLYYALGHYYYEVNLKYGDQWMQPSKEVLSNAKKNFEKAREFGVSDYYSLFALGVIALNDGDLVKAKSFLSESVRLKSDYPSSTYNLAYVYYQMKDYKGGIGYAKKSFEQYTDTVYKSDAAKMLGNMYLNLKEYSNAVTYFQKGIEIYPDDYYTHDGLLRTYLAMNKIDEANAQADRMFASHPTYPNVPRFISNDYWDAHQDKELENFFSRNISSNTDAETLGNLYFYQALFYADAKNDEKAKESFLSAKKNFSKVFKPDNRVFKVIDGALQKFDKK